MVQIDTVPPDILNVRAIEGTCKNVSMVMSPQRIFTPFLNAIGTIVLIIGMYQFLERWSPMFGQVSSKVKL